MSDFNQRENQKAGIFNILTMLFFGGVLFAAVYVGLDTLFHTSGIMPHK